MPRLPGIFTDSEYRIVQKMISLDTASKYHLRRQSPHRSRRMKIVALIGRDPWNGQTAPVATSQDVEHPRATPMPIIPRPHISINPCVDESVCLAVRRAAMRPIANTLLDARRTVPCTNCKEGIQRAKAEAKKKVAHIGALVCSCGEEKSRDASTCHACASERKRGTA